MEDHDMLIVVEQYYNAVIEGDVKPILLLWKHE